MDAAHDPKNSIERRRVRDRDGDRDRELGVDAVAGSREHQVSF